jgi:hypothetical protein
MLAAKKFAFDVGSGTFEAEVKAIRETKQGLHLD